MRFSRKLSIILITFTLYVSNVLAEAVEEETFRHLDSQNWQAAEKSARISKNQALIKIVLSQKFLDSKYLGNNFESVISFIRANPHWPGNEKLKCKAEKYLDHSTNKQLIVEWFNEHKPAGALGYKFYALAAAQLIDDQRALMPIIKNGWIYGDFSLEEEKKYLNNFGKYLSEEDHIKRIDEHLWKSNIAEAKRSLYLVSPNYRKVFEVEIAIIQNNPAKEKLFMQIPEKYYTSGLLYNYLQSKRKEIPDARSIALFKKVKADKMHSKEWCKLQLYYAREFIDQKDFASSYKIISQHFADEHDDIREAEWLCGWLALQFLSRPNIALQHFENFSKIVKTPISLARGAYWLGRTYEALKDRQKSTKYYKEASIYSYTFYGQLAALELKQDSIILPPTPKGELHHKKSIENNDIFKAVKLLMKYGKKELAHAYVKVVIKHSTPEELVWLADLVRSLGDYYYITEFGKHASQSHIFIKEYAFPTPYKISSSPIEAPLTYGIIRQESVFNQYAISSAKAMGLMQLVKDTACRTAKSMNVKCDVAKLTENPNYNILIGTHHLRDLIKERKGSYILTIASYNTTTCNVNKWIKRFGDPRQLKNMRDVIDWIELIPFSETRNYVQRVLENIQVYRAILNKTNKLKLRQDLGV